MLELRPGCEICDRDLPPASTEAVICAFECPNCGGGLVPRPVRPREMLARSPASTRRVVKPLDAAKHGALLARYRDVPAERR